MRFRSYVRLNSLLWKPLRLYWWDFRTSIVWVRQAVILNHLVQKRSLTTAPPWCSSLTLRVFLVFRWFSCEIFHFRSIRVPFSLTCPLHVSIQLIRSSLRNAMICFGHKQAILSLLDVFARGSSVSLGPSQSTLDVNKRYLLITSRKYNIIVSRSLFDGDQTY